MSARHKRRLVCGGLRASAAVLPLAGLMLLGSATISLLTAQTGAPRRTVWDGAYTEAQATRGATSFGQSCAGCHVLATPGRSPLVGDSFWKSFAQKNVAEMLDYITANMPNGSPRSLGESTYSDIVALLLKSNGFPAGATELARNTIDDVQIVPKDGNTELSANTLVRVVGCLARRGADQAKSGADWVVTKATPPERAERTASAGEDATRPLGSRTMQLKFVLTKLDAWVDSRVAVSGLLIGADGVDGINVTAVNRVTQKCP